MAPAETWPGECSISYPEHRVSTDLTFGQAFSSCSGGVPGIADHSGTCPAGLAKVGL